MIRALAFIAALWAGGAQAQCRQALALGLDVSGSVDAQEYRLQMHGLAAALEDPDVLAALSTLVQNPVYITVYEWSGPEYQRVIVPWVKATTPDHVRAITGPLRAQVRTTVAPTTGLGTALQFGAGLLQTGPTCLRRTLDISGDGKNNSGPTPGEVQATLGRIEVNALIIGIDAPARLSHEEIEIGELAAYFRNSVIRGPQAFLEVALGFPDYARAMRLKLLKELEIPSLSFVHQ